MDLKDLISGGVTQVEIPESVINTLIRKHGLNYTVQICNDHIALSANNFTAEFSYHSHDFNHNRAIIHFCLKRIKPLYYSFGLRLITNKYPYLEYWKDNHGNKILTCSIDKIPGINSILKDYTSYTDYVESVDCREGKIIVGLCRKSVVTKGGGLHV